MDRPPASQGSGGPGGDACGADVIRWPLNRVGREVSADLAASRLVTLTGVGGVGKTRIALRVAETVSTSFPDGVWWCELAPLTDAAAVEPALSTVLGVQRQVGVGGVESVLAFLARMRLLLVLDNCEHVLSGVRPMVDAILSRCPGAAVLATSRTPLGVAGERLRPIAAAAAARPEPDLRPRFTGGEAVPGPRPRCPARSRRHWHESGPRRRCVHPARRTSAGHRARRQRVSGR